jgi:hypothetical protein
MQFRHAALASLFVLSFSGAAFAGTADDAQSHFKAIAKGQVEDIMKGYADNAHFEWVGGPLNGTYVGADKIKEVWSKFAKANAPLELSVTKIEESANPAGSTVTANVEFKGKNTIKVRYVLNYRDGKLASEVWQIDPKLATAAY